MCRSAWQLAPALSSLGSTTECGLRRSEMQAETTLHRDGISNQVPREEPIDAGKSWSTEINLVASRKINQVVDVGGPAAFFFQAEDGIRDSSVTGVQTCALPI